MTHSFSRRQFMITSAAASAVIVVPRWISAATSSGNQHVEIHADSEIAVIRPEFHGHFAEHLGSCIYGGLWVGKNSSIPNIDGYRKQAVEYLRELGIPVLRWPGGCFADDYHWRDGIGPMSKRPKRVNIHWGGYVEGNSFGTHEFIGLCRLIGAEPYLAGNVGSGSPEEMRDWIEYCNLPSRSTLAEERRQNGASEPFQVRYWGVGNESWGCGGWMRPEVYADHYRRFSVYLREFGGTQPYLIASGPNGNDTRWSRGLLDRLDGGLPDGFAMHYYEGGADEPTHFTNQHASEQFAKFAKVEEAIQQQRSLLDSYHNGRNVGLVLDEWGVWDNIPEAGEKKYGKLWQQSTMRSAVAAGLGLNIFNRQADKLSMCNIAQITNVLQSLLVTDGAEGRNCVRTATYFAFLLFKPHRSNTAVKVLTDDSTSAGVSVSASKGNGELAASFVNPTGEEIDVTCDLRGVRGNEAIAQILHDPDINAYNGFDHSDRIHPMPFRVTAEGAKMRLELPGYSVVTAKVRMA